MNTVFSQCFSLKEERKLYGVKRRDIQSIAQSHFLATFLSVQVPTAKKKLDIKEIRRSAVVCPAINDCFLLPPESSGDVGGRRDR